MKKLEFKLAFLDEYEKFTLHQELYLGSIQHQMVAERFKLINTNVQQQLA
jgi:hypothetical protein